MNKKSERDKSLINGIDENNFLSIKKIFMDEIIFIDAIDEKLKFFQLFLRKVVEIFEPIYGLYFWRIDLKVSFQTEKKFGEKSFF